MRRVRTLPAREPGWGGLVGAWLRGRAGFGVSLAASLAVAVVALGIAPPAARSPGLHPQSLIVAYAKLAGGR
jgi:hypothetical protein